ncbi:choice-of-anchor M domain-containing protein [Nocardiopsis sp. ARC36]
MWRDLSDVVLQVVDTATVEVPDDERFAFLGSPGDEVWMLPQVQQDGVLWPGWNTQDPEVASAVDREVTWTLHGVEGPGDFTLFLNTDFGDPQTVFDGDGDMPQETGVDVGTHAHGNWAFTSPGTYLLEIEMSATTLDGTQVGDRGRLAVHAGEENPEAAFDLLAQQGPADDPDGANAATDGTSALPGWAWAAGGAGAVLLLLVAVLLGMLLGRRARRKGEER